MIAIVGCEKNSKYCDKDRIDCDGRCIGSDEVCLCGDAVCMGGQICDAGKCKCMPGMVNCGGECINPLTSQMNCGAKGTCSENTPANDHWRGANCVEKATCVRGVCQCPDGEFPCGRSCVNPLTSVNHCGARFGGTCSDGIETSANYRGINCRNGACVDGECQCPGGYILCDAGCVDAQTNNGNCRRGARTDHLTDHAGYRRSHMDRKRLIRNLASTTLSLATDIGYEVLQPTDEPYDNLRHDQDARDQAWRNLAWAALSLAADIGQEVIDSTYSPAEILTLQQDSVHPCGNAVCMGGQICDDGKCRCPTGMVNCSGVCIDPLTSQTFCGAKGTCTGSIAANDDWQGNHCAEGTACVWGTCRLQL